SCTTEVVSCHTLCLVAEPVQPPLSKSHGPDLDASPQADSIIRRGASCVTAPAARRWSVIVRPCSARCAHVESLPLSAHPAPPIMHDPHRALLRRDREKVRS